MKSRAIVDVVAYCLILLFLHATIRQLAFHHSFYLQLSRSLAHDPLAIVLSWALPATGLLLALLLCRPASRLTGLCCALGVVSIFTVYLVIMLPDAYRSACNCGEVWQGATLEANILFNVAVILLTGIAIIIAGRYKNETGPMHVNKLFGLKRQMRQ